MAYPHTDMFRRLRALRHLPAWLALAFASMVLLATAAPLWPAAAQAPTSQICRGAGHQARALPTQLVAEPAAPESGSLGLLDCPLCLALGLTPAPEFSATLHPALRAGPLPAPPMSRPVTTAAWVPPARGPPVH